ncbi:hypothetical protein Clacol_002726 [Clathrus columnatus]|uniref:General vesicular transport factor p115 n=1 Tax=Clathrus columnatus TaxID=1419009 RepID=A0AAV5A4W2_9AGAM|nr:hypothetical protein Clacol_002726 [Clathrus columnatus]
MDFLSQTYNALRGPAGAPQIPSETIRKLSDRLSQETLLSDRRAAVLSLKGLSKDCKAEVGEISLFGLLDVLEKDSDIDADITKAVLETLTSLCDVNDENDGLPTGKALGMKHTDVVLSTAQTCNKLFQLIGDTAFYTRFGALSLLQILLQNRKIVVQGYFIKSPVGFSHVVALLEDKREIIRNEGLTMLQVLISQNAEIQKILAFEGVFEKLLNIITAEGGLEGGIIVQNCLNSIDGLLRFNVSNLSYFRETSLWTQLTSLFMFPSNLPPDDPAPAEFALQFWEAQKKVNMGILVGILGLLVGNKGKSSEQSILLRCLLELALASNAPTAIKNQALRLLPVSLVLSKAVLTPYQPVPDTNGEEWDRLEPTTAVNALINNVVEGEYAGIIDGQDGGKQDALQFRALSLSVFQNYCKEEELRLEILQTLVPSQGPKNFKKNMAALNLLSALTTFPTSPLSTQVSNRIHLSTLLFSIFFNRSHTAPSLAQHIIPSLVTQQNPSTPGSYFIPADGGHPNQNQVDESDNDERQQTLLQTLTEHLTLSFLSRSRAVEQGDSREEREWDRVIVGYLILLSQWLYDSPASVREFLDNGGLSVVGVDVLVQGLCSFLLAVCYEYDRDPGEITRQTVHSIIHRLTPDILSARMNSVRDDDRFKSVSPDSAVLSYIGSQSGVVSPKTHISQNLDAEIWFDWNFVEFWKLNSYSMQRAITMDPATFAAQPLENEALTPSLVDDNPEQAAVVSSLREIIQRQATELEQLRGVIQQEKPVASESSVANSSLQDTVQQQKRELEILRSEIEQKTRKFDEEKRAIIDQLVLVQEEFNNLQTSKAEADKEQEDLLVFLEELSTKRKRDKERMRNAGLAVSEDEAEADD